MYQLMRILTKVFILRPPLYFTPSIFNVATNLQTKINKIYQKSKSSSQKKSSDLDLFWYFLNLCIFFIKNKQTIKHLRLDLHTIFRACRQNDFLEGISNLPLRDGCKASYSMQLSSLDILFFTYWHCEEIALKLELIFLNLTL